MDINLNDLMENVNELAENAVRLAKDVASKATQKTEDIVGVSKIKMDTMKLQSEIKSLKAKLGGAVYEMAAAGDTDPQVIDQYVAELKVKYEQLDALKKEQEAMKKTVVCEACRSINPKTAFFCSRCGAPLPVSEDGTEDTSEEEDILADAFDEEAPAETEAPADLGDIEAQAMVDGADADHAAEIARDAAEEEGAN